MSKRLKPTIMLSKRDTIAGLRYIANSPAPNYGGFNPATVLIAKSALKHFVNKGRA